MAETAMEKTAAADPAVVVKSPKKAKTAAGTKKPKKAATHPPTNTMLVAAIKALKERNGSSLHAIKKYLVATYKVDVIKLGPFIRKALKTGVASGKLVQAKGSGLSGSFKLSAQAKKPVYENHKKKTVSTKKSTVAGDKQKTAGVIKKVEGGAVKKTKAASTKKPKTAAAKASGVKKAATKKKPAVPKQKSTKHSKKTGATKPRARKPKKVVGAGPAKKPATAKKVAAEKK